MRAQQAGSKLTTLKPALKLLSAVLCLPNTTAYRGAAAATAAETAPGTWPAKYILLSAKIPFEQRNSSSR